MSSDDIEKDTQKANAALNDGKRRKPKLPANVGTLPVGDDPFKDYLIDDWHYLDEIGQRSVCPKCNKSRKYFCYSCYVPVTELTGRIPKVKLPIKVDIIKHAREIDGKSTASHAAVLAPDDVTIYTYPCIPDYEQQPGKVVLVFPGKNATSLGDYIKKLKERDELCPPASKRTRPSSLLSIERAVLIDSTWNQCRGIYKDSRLKDLPCVVLQERISQFWRHQEGSPRWYLATVEAVHQLLLELHAAVSPTTPLATPAALDTSHDESNTPEPHAGSPSNKAEEITCEAECVQVAEQEAERLEEVSKQDVETATYQADHECHDYDNLLFFFRFMYDKIHRLYEPETLRAYKRPLDL